MRRRALYFGRQPGSARAGCVTTAPAPLLCRRYFLRFFGSTDVEKVLDAMEYAVYVHDVEHIVLDNLQFMMGTSAGKVRTNRVASTTGACTSGQPVLAAWWLGDADRATLYGGAMALSTPGL